jgi:hypothetical protein
MTGNFVTYSTLGSFYDWSRRFPCFSAPVTPPSPPWTSLPPCGSSGCWSPSGRDEN